MTTLCRKFPTAAAMLRLWVFFLVVFFLGVHAEEDVEDEDDDMESRLISIGVDPLLCSTRNIHDRLVSGGHGYYFSWEEPNTRNLRLDWLEARKFCRERCMDLVSLETLFEAQYIAGKVEKGNQNNVWTSGRKCTFNGCDRQDLKPIDVRGWFWAGSLAKLPPTTDRQGTDWSETGGIGMPQPDNREGAHGGEQEDCLAILNNYYNDAITWHDVACSQKMPFVCEDSDTLLSTVFPLPSIDVRIN